MRSVEEQHNPDPIRIEPGQTCNVVFGIGLPHLGPILNRLNPSTLGMSTRSMFAQAGLIPNVPLLEAIESDSSIIERMGAGEIVNIPGTVSNLSMAPRSFHANSGIGRFVNLDPNDRVVGKELKGIAKLEPKNIVSDDIVLAKIDRDGEIPILKDGHFHLSDRKDWVAHTQELMERRRKGSLDVDRDSNFVLGITKHTIPIPSKYLVWIESSTTHSGIKHLPSQLLDPEDHSGGRGYWRKRVELLTQEPSGERHPEAIRLQFYRIAGDLTHDVQLRHSGQHFSGY
jgi:hypothetical protein